MIGPTWLVSSIRDDGAFRSTVAFLRGRLKNRETILWALGLSGASGQERLALIHLLNSPEGRTLAEPWRTRWRLIEEAWRDEDVALSQGGSLQQYELKERIASGERSGALLAELVDAVRPRLHFERRRLTATQLSTRGQVNISRLLKFEITSGELEDPSELGLDTELSLPFLLELAHRLDAALQTGLDVAARALRLHHNAGFWPLGGLARARYVAASERVDDEAEPDRFQRGIAPTTKLLHYIVSRIASLSLIDAKQFSTAWKANRSPVYARLWAALALNRQVVTPSEVATFVLERDDIQFWSSGEFPEIAELRSAWFSEFSSERRREILARIAKGPPRTFVRRDIDASQRIELRDRYIARELKRISLSAPDAIRSFNQKLQSLEKRFPDIASIKRRDFGFPQGPTVLSTSGPTQSGRFDDLSGVELLTRLEAALTARRVWDEDPGAEARAFIAKPSNLSLTIRALDKAKDVGAFAAVIECVGWSVPTPQRGSDAPSLESARVLDLLNLIVRMPSKTIDEALDGLTHFVSNWAAVPEQADLVYLAWNRLWPHAVAATNALRPIVEDEYLSGTGQSVGDDEPADLDTLNTPAGRLVGAFLQLLAKSTTPERVFDDPNLCALRDTMLMAGGRAELIARYRMIEQIPYFLRIDPEWTKQTLITALLDDSPESYILWRALGHRMHFSAVLTVLGESVIERAVDPHTGSRTRESLAFSVVVESLHAFRDQRQPAISNSAVQQMLRRLDDVTRAAAAQAVQRFVSEMGAKSSPESAFNDAAKPFLRTVWPPERSLTTPAIAEALADLPSVCGEEFPQAVEEIHRFLVPFQVWSLLSYGLFGEIEEKTKLEVVINTRAKADALLMLFDSTIGDETTVVPYGLDDALERIRQLSPAVASTPPFRRLETLTRR